MPPQSGEAADGRTNYNSGFKNKARALRACGDAQSHAYPPGRREGFAYAALMRSPPARAESEPGKHRGWRAHAAVMDGFAGQERVPLQQGARAPTGAALQR